MNIVGVCAPSFVKMKGFISLMVRQKDDFLQKRHDNLLNIKNIRNFAARYVQFGEISHRFGGLKG